jgi:RimJ/RimL family protein N-acetyltransferase
MSSPAVRSASAAWPAGDKAGICLMLGEGAYLRPLRPDDVTLAYVAGLNDPAVNRFLVGVRVAPQTAATVRAYVESNWRSETDLLLGLFADATLRGTVRVHDVSWQDGHGYMGIVIFDRAYWGRGLGAQALNAVRDFCFRTLGVTSLTAGIYASNKASQKSFERAGFEYQPDGDRPDPYDRILFWQATAATVAGKSLPNVDRS